MEPRDKPRREPLNTVLQMYANGHNIKAISAAIRAQGHKGIPRSVKNWLIAEGVYEGNSSYGKPVAYKAPPKYPERKCRGCGTDLSETHRTLTVCLTCAPDVMARNRFFNYGLKHADYVAMLDKQEHRCAICEVALLTLDSKRVHIDHDHKTGKVRGVLCQRCNTGLYLFENEKTRARALEYVSRQ